MDGLIKEWVDQWMTGRQDEWMKGWRVECLDEWMGGLLNGMDIWRGA
jgi:hypothetical protein